MTLVIRSHRAPQAERGPPGRKPVLEASSKCTTTTVPLLSDRIHHDHGLRLTTILQTVNFTTASILEPSRDCASASVCALRRIFRAAASGQPFLPRVLTPENIFYSGYSRR